MRQTSLYRFTSLSFFLLIFLKSLFCQQTTQKRLELQYQELKSNLFAEKQELKIKIANAYLTENYPEKAESVLEKINKDSVHSFQFFFTYAKVCFAQDRFDESLLYINQIEIQKLDNDQLNEISLFKIICLNHLFKWEESKTLLCEHILSCSNDTSGISNTYQSVINDIYFDSKKAGKKSWIPGAGLFYVKEPNRAVMSIFLNTLFLGYTVYSIYTKYYFTSFLTGVSQFMRFYSGGRRAAINYSNKKNQQTLLKSLIFMDEYCKNKFFCTK